MTTFSEEEGNLFAYRVMVALRDAGVEDVLPARNSKGSPKFIRQYLGALAITENLFRVRLLHDLGGAWSSAAARGYRNGYLAAVLGLRLPDTASLADVLPSVSERDRVRHLGGLVAGLLDERQISAPRPFAELYSLLQDARNSIFAESLASIQKLRGDGGDLAAAFAATSIVSYSAWVWDGNLSESYNAGITRPLSQVINEVVLKVNIGGGNNSRSVSESARGPESSICEVLENVEVFKMSEVRGKWKEMLVSKIWRSPEEVSILEKYNDSGTISLQFAFAILLFAVACKSVIDRYGSGKDIVKELKDAEALLFQRIEGDAERSYCKAQMVLRRRVEFKQWERHLAEFGESHDDDTNYGLGMVYRVIYAERLLQYQKDFVVGMSSFVEDSRCVEYGGFQAILINRFISDLTGVDACGVNMASGDRSDRAGIDSYLIQMAVVQMLVEVVKHADEFNLIGGE